MTHYQDDWLTIHGGDCREVLRSLPDESVQMVCTSPPYWGLRDYGVTGQLGLERTPDEYVAAMVDVFREVRRVLRRDGTLWLNLGDSYAGSGKGAWDRTDVQKEVYVPLPGGAEASIPKVPAGLKPKDLVGIPWRVAFALQADGWVLRSEIVWSKPNPMPESVTDRPTKSHEQLFLFSKGKRIGPDPTPWDDISDSDARWLAAVFDTEGSIVIRREAPKGEDYGAHAAQVSVGNTSVALLEEVARIVGRGTILERGGQNAPMHYWQASGKVALGLLRRIYPFLVVKQRQARCAIALEEGKRYPGGHARIAPQEVERRERLWQAVKSLNHFGTPDLSGIPEPVFGRWTSERYHYDADAIAEPAGAQNEHDYTGGGYGVTPPGQKPQSGSRRKSGNLEPVWDPASETRGAARFKHSIPWEGATRNRRSVWTVATQPYPGAHFATFPEALVEPCILAGCPEGGVVLDPFAGTGTVGVVAQRLSRRAVLIDLNPDYLRQCLERNQQAPLGLSA